MDVKFFEGFPNVFDSLDGEFGGVAGLKNHIFSLMCFLNTDSGAGNTKLCFGTFFNRIIQYQNRIQGGKEKEWNRGAMLLTCAACPAIFM